MYVCVRRRWVHARIRMLDKPPYERTDVDNGRARKPPAELPYSYEAVQTAIRVFICEYFRTGRKSVTRARIAGGGAGGGVTNVRSVLPRSVCICFHPQNDTVHDCGTRYRHFPPFVPTPSRSRARKILARIWLDGLRKISHRFGKMSPRPRRQIGVSCPSSDK